MPRDKDISIPISAIGKKRILVADDDAGIRDIFSIILEQAGYIADVKESGDKLLKNDFVNPDLFLIDKQLSGTSGIDICRHLKNNKETKHLPVIMISASPDIGMLSREAGADAFIEKPFQIGYLLKMVAFYVR
jgi:DNA-binding response OmpR family regulator